MRKLLAAAAAVLAFLALAVVFAPGAVLTVFTRLTWPAASADAPVWVALAFARLAAAALLVCAVLLMVLRSVLPAPAERRAAQGIAMGMAVLALIAAAQAQALFTTPASWALAGVVGLLALSFAAVGWRARAA